MGRKFSLTLSRPISLETKGLLLIRTRSCSPELTLAWALPATSHHLTSHHLLITARPGRKQVACTPPDIDTADGRTFWVHPEQLAQAAAEDKRVVRDNPEFCGCILGRMNRPEVWSVSKRSR